MALNLITLGIGAAVGAVAGAATSVVTSLSRGEEIDWANVGAMAAGGAATGALAGATFGGSLVAGGAAAAARTGGMVAAGATGGAVERVVDNVAHDREWDDDVLTHTAWGGALGAGGAALRAAGPALRPLGSRALRAGGRVLRSTPRYLGVAARETGRGLARGGGLALRGARGAGSVVGRGWRGYSRLISDGSRWAVPVKSATSGVIIGSGEMIAQTADDEPGVDWGRVAFMTGFGAAWAGPAGHYWFRFLSRKLPGTSLLSRFGRVAIDQAAMAPFGTAVYFAADGLYEGDSLGEIGDRMVEDGPSTMAAAYVIWIPVQTGNLGFVKSKYQVLVANLAGLGWSTVLAGGYDDEVLGAVGLHVEKGGGEDEDAEGGAVEASAAEGLTAADDAPTYEHGLIDAVPGR